MLMTIIIIIGNNYKVDSSIFLYILFKESFKIKMKSYTNRLTNIHSPYVYFYVIKLIKEMDNH